MNPDRIGYPDYELDEDTTLDGLLHTPQSGLRPLRHQIESLVTTLPFLGGRNTGEQAEFDEKTEQIQRLIGEATDNNLITQHQHDRLLSIFNEELPHLRGRFIEELRHAFGAPRLSELDRAVLRDELLQRIAYQPPAGDPDRSPIGLLVANTLDTAEYRACRDTACEFCTEFAEPRLNAA